MIPDSSKDHRTWAAMCADSDSGSETTTRSTAATVTFLPLHRVWS